MLSQILSACIDGYAAWDRSTDRDRMVEAARARVAEHRAAGRERALVIVRSASEMRDGLRSIASRSAVVFVDCALECCVDEEDLLRCWRELRRVTGATDERADDLFVLTIQRWASMRVNLDPRVRWIVLAAPPRRDGTGRLEFRPFGRRRTVLADVAEERRARLAGEGPRIEDDVEESERRR